MGKNDHHIVRISSLRVGYSLGIHSYPILPPLTALSAGGELVAVIGRNGIGKSTFLRTIAGLQPSLEGETLIDGVNISVFSRTDLARKIGFISTEVVNVSNMRVIDLVALGRFPYTNWIGKLTQNDKLMIEEAIVRTGLSGMENRNINEISDGERQKAMIARVLAQNTDIMILDEPTAFLDIASRFEILNLMHDLSRDGKTIIFSTHDFSSAIRNADKIWLLLDSGLYEGSPEDLMMTGLFENLFKASALRFDPANGTFSIQPHARGKIYLEGCGDNRKWIEMAVVRNGYSVSESMTDPYICVSTEGEQNWSLITEGKVINFKSIYDLIRNLQH